MRGALFAILVVIFGSAASACTIDVKGAGYAMINVWAQPDRGVCDLQNFPKPWNSLLGMQQGTSRAFFWNYEDKQVAYVMFQISKTGKGRVIFHYTNDKWPDGDTFSSGILFLDSDKVPIGYIGSQRGVNGKSAGDDVKQLSETPEFWSRVRYLKFGHWYADKWEDDKIGRAITSVASALGCAYYGVCIGP